MRDPDRFLTQLWAMERALVASGLEPMPDWWRREVTRFYQSGKRRWVIRKGRRVFASTCVAPRLAVAEMLFGEHRHIPGSPPLIYAFLSVQRGEATERITGITAVLSALSVPHRVVGSTVAIEGQPALFKVVTASFKASVGGTCAFAWCDEVRRWNDPDSSKNPAEHVIGSLAPMLATLDDAKLLLVSSPWSTKDFHAKCFDDGDQANQMVSFGETWTINPSFSEEKTHAEEPNLRAWTREYAAIPVDGVEEDWFGMAVDLAFADDPEVEALRTQPGGMLGASYLRNGMKPVFTIDPAFAKHYFGYAVTTSEPAANDNSRRLTLVHDSGAWEPKGEPREALEMLRDRVLIPHMQLAGCANDTMIVHTDQAGFYPLREVARQVGITLIEVPWTGGDGESSKRTRYRNTRAAMLGNEVRILSHRTSEKRRARLKGQFRSVSGVVAPGGTERIVLIEDDKVGHCDELSAIVHGVSICLERPPTAARAVTVVRKEDNPAAWRAEAVRKVEEKRRQEWKQSPHAVMRRAMGR